MASKSPKSTHDALKSAFGIRFSLNKSHDGIFQFRLLYVLRKLFSDASPNLWFRKYLVHKRASSIEKTNHVLKIRAEDEIAFPTIFKRLKFQGDKIGCRNHLNLLAPYLHCRRGSQRLFKPTRFPAKNFFSYGQDIHDDAPREPTTNWSVFAHVMLKAPSLQFALFLMEILPCPHVRNDIHILCNANNVNRRVINKKRQDRTAQERIVKRDSLESFVQGRN